MNEDSTQAASSYRSHMSFDQRYSILQYLLRRCKNGKLEVGAINDASALFEYHTQSVSRLWKRSGLSKTGRPLLTPEMCKDNKEGRCGRKKKDHSQTLKKMYDIPLEQRSSLSLLSKALDMPKTTLHRLVKEGKIIKRSLDSPNPPLKQNNSGNVQLSKQNTIHNNIEYVYELYEPTSSELKLNNKSSTISSKKLNQLNNMNNQQKSNIKSSSHKKPKPKKTKSIKEPNHPIETQPVNN